MGQIISCCSYMHDSGVTANTALIAVKLANLFPEKRILTIDTNNKRLDLQKVLQANHSKGLNINSLINLASTEGLTDEKFCYYCTQTNVRNLYNINAASNNVFNNIKIDISCIEKILDKAKDIFDIVIVDNVMGSSLLTNKINNKSNIVMHFIIQNVMRLDYLKDSNEFKDFEDAKVLTVVNKFSTKKGVQLNELSSIYKLKNIFPLLVSDDLCYCINNCDIPRFLNEYLAADEKYMEAFNKLVVELCKRMEYQIIIKELPTKTHKNLLNIKLPNRIFHKSKVIRNEGE